MRDQILGHLNLHGPHSLPDLAEALDVDDLDLCNELIDLIAESSVMLESDLTLWYAEPVE